MCILVSVKTWEVGIVRVKITAGEDEISLDETNEWDSYVLRVYSIKLAGYSLAAALYLLHQCPTHSRYVRRGIGKRKHLDIQKFLTKEDDVVRSCVMQISSQDDVIHATLQTCSYSSAPGAICCEIVLPFISVIVMEKYSASYPYTSL